MNEEQPQYSMDSVKIHEGSSTMSTLGSFIM